MFKRLKTALLALACLIPLTASALVQQHPLQSPATSLVQAYDTTVSIFPNTQSYTHETLVIIGYSDGSVLAYTCRNNPMGGYDPLGLASYSDYHNEKRVGDDGVPEVQRLERDHWNWSRMAWDTKWVWRKADKEELQWYFSKQNGKWKSLSALESRDARNAWIGRTLDKSADQFVGGALVYMGGVYAGAAAPTVLPVLKSAYDSAGIYAYVKGGYYLKRALGPLAVAGQWVRARLGRGQTPVPSTPLPGYGSLTQARIGFIDRATGQMVKQGTLGLDSGQLSSHAEIVEKYLASPATAQGFSLIPQADGTYLLRASGQYGGDVSAVLAKIAEFYQIAVEKIVVR